MSPRWLDKRTGDHLALDTGGGPIARLWATALAGLRRSYIATEQREDLMAQRSCRKPTGRVRMEGAEVS